MSARHDFIARSREALYDPVLQSALAKARPGFVNKRLGAVDAIPEFQRLRDRAEAARRRSLADLDTYLGIFQRRVETAGGHVHWAASTDELRDIVLSIARQNGARTATKGKSMVAEEADLNAALEEAGVAPVETDLGEYILQLAEEPPSHIVAPALHKTREQITELFRSHHDLGQRDLASVKAIVDEARRVIRERYLSADIGITGANLLIADTGTSVLCTNEGNGDLTASLPDTHIVVTSIDKVVADWRDASAVLRVLARSATGQPITTYTSLYGPRREGDLDGPVHFHVVLLDNHRSDLLGGEFQSMLHCIKCGACMNHCPVYQSVGGHAYEAVYPGPMGSVLTPLLRGDAGDETLAEASSFCGRCEAVCPVNIPLPDLLRRVRERTAARQPLKGGRIPIRLYMWLARRPQLYRRLTSMTTSLLARLAGRHGRFRRFPGLKRWTRYRDLAAPAGASFQQQWRKTRKR